MTPRVAASERGPAQTAGVEARAGLYPLFLGVEVGAEDPENPEIPESPESPEIPEIPEIPENPDNPENPACAVRRALLYFRASGLKVIMSQ